MLYDVAHDLLPQFFYMSCFLGAWLVTLLTPPFLLTESSVSLAVPPILPAWLLAYQPFNQAMNETIIYLQYTEGLFHSITPGYP